VAVGGGGAEEALSTILYMHTEQVSQWPFLCRFDCHRHAMIGTETAEQSEQPAGASTAVSSHGLWARGRGDS
jgi:hypothetical protein